MAYLDPQEVRAVLIVRWAPNGTTSLPLSVLPLFRQGIILHHHQASN